MDQTKDLSYHYLRSHHYFIFNLARKLGVNNVLDHYFSRSQEIIPGNDIHYTLKEFPEYTLKTATPHDYGESIGVIFHTKITRENYSELHRFARQCTKLIYYNSDREYHPNYLGSNPMLLEFLRSKPQDSLSQLLNQKLICVLTGFNSMIKKIHHHFGRCPVIYVPQVINPNIPRFKSSKEYDGFMINNSSTHAKINEELEKEGLSTFSIVPDVSYVQSDCIQFPDIGAHLDILLASASMCKYHITTHVFQLNKDPLMVDKACTHSLTFKYFESYYANLYPMTCNKSLPMIIETMKSDLYKDQKKFNRWLEDNYSLKNYKLELNEITRLCLSSFGIKTGTSSLKKLR